MIKVTRKRILYGLLFSGLGLVTAMLATGFYFRSQWFKDTPNTLTINGELPTVSFTWGSQQRDSAQEPHNAMLIPVRIEGFPNTFHMQFDTGAANTFLRSEAVQALIERGQELELYRQDDEAFVRKFEFTVGSSKVVLNNGHVRGRSAQIDWDDPNAKNLIGTIGTDFLDQGICEINFPAKQMRLYDHVPERFSESNFTQFDFQGRRIVLPVKLAGRNEHVLWDSGCSSFGLLTSAYFYDELTDETVKETKFNANRHGDPVFIHQRASDMPIIFGDTSVPIRNIAYANLYESAQVAFGRFSGLVGFIGFLGNKPFLDCTLVIDAQANQFLVVRSEMTQ